MNVNNENKLLYGNMKRIIILVALASFALSMWAQKEKEVTLGEVEVKGSRVVNTAEGQNIYPTDKQISSSTNGYSLLNKLALPDIFIDEVAHTITSKGYLGDVQVRVNNIVATRQDLLSLDMKSVKHIEYIRNPGVRYGQDVAFVINIVTRRATSGYVIGTDMLQTLTLKRSDYELFCRWNRGKSEFDVSGFFFHHNLKGGLSETDSHYFLQDGTTYDKQIKDISISDKVCNSELKLRYNLADSDRYVLQITLNGGFRNAPDNTKNRELTIENEKYLSSLYTHDRTSTPSLDLYYYTSIGRHQNITANLVGTYIGSKYAYNLDEMGENYAYMVTGDSYSLNGEAIYENVLKPFTFSSGMQFLQKYMRNDYSGDVETTTSDRTSDLYLFGQIKGKLKPLRYVLGLGVSRQYYCQAADKYDYWLLRPKMTLSMPFLNRFNVKYDLGFQQHPPRVEYLSNVSVRTDEMDKNEGNPTLKPAKRIEHDFTVSYQSQRLYTSIEAFYRINLHPVMQEIYRENDLFVFTRSNQRKIYMLNLTNYTRFDIIPDKLSATFNGGLLRCFNYGKTYKHHYSSFNFNLNMQAFLGKFTLQAYVDNGWRFLEGESKDRRGAVYYGTVSYHIGNFDISLFAQHLFQKNPKTEEYELLNSYVRRTSTAHNTDLGNMISLNVSWKLSRGRKYTDVKRSMNNADKETGILK